MTPSKRDEPTKNRATAKDAVRQTWQDRRRTVTQRPVPPVSVCYTVKNAWMQLWKEWSDHHKLTATTATAPTKEVKRERKPRGTPRPQFASVVSMIQKNEIVRQVKSIQEEVALKEVLSVLPTGYDWTKAIQETASKRSRAFWLLDLSVIVRNCVNLKRPGVRYVYDVHLSTNTDPVLLKVLLRSNSMSLSTTTKWDLDRCKSILSLPANKTPQHPLIVDSAVCCGKPDGYIREWMRLSQPDNPGPLVVNGPGEVRRIAATVQRIRLRSPVSEQPKQLHFSLRFEGEDLASWKDLFDATIETIETCGGCLVGISLPVPESLCDEFLPHLEHLLAYIIPSKSSVAPQLQLDLRGSVIGSDAADLGLDPNVLLDRLSKREDVALLTVDVTKLLLATAGALCTRVIGVREQEVTDAEGGGHHLRRHYYIDDGCYGSLCVAKDTITPLPLFAHHNTNTSASSPSDTVAVDPLYETCIWGPTCDGLDRVCQSIQLPAMQRDDWLVFAGMSSGGEGLSTAFNGFNPPDTAYCVLGYFGQSSSTSNISKS